MNRTLAAILTGFCIDCLLGDPHSLPHPVVLIGKLITALETRLRAYFPKDADGERKAGAVLWVITAGASFLVPLILLLALQRVSYWLALIVECIMCWQIFAAKSLMDESMKVFRALKNGDLIEARRAVSMIVGRDTEELDEAGVVRAAIETVAENTSDGVIAPLFYMMIGGAPLGFFYKAVNTMDSMLGYIDPPYTYIGYVPARADDVLNYIPSRLSALFMLAAGKLLRLDVSNGVRIWKRDRRRHTSPNSAQTESACAGLLGVELGGTSTYRGVTHRKPCIGTPLRPVRAEDIPRTCGLMYTATLLALILFSVIRWRILPV